ncbi:Os05g0564601, partial [Oryza sativa Japonica Group]
SITRPPNFPSAPHPPRGGDRPHRRHRARGLRLLRPRRPPPQAPRRQLPPSSSSSAAPSPAVLTAIFQGAATLLAFTRTGDFLAELRSYVREEDGEVILKLVGGLGAAIFVLEWATLRRPPPRAPRHPLPLSLPSSAAPAPAALTQERTILKRRRSDAVKEEEKRGQRDTWDGQCAT